VTQYWFPDTTVLCNFASVERLPLLRQVLDGRGRWVEAIAHEVGKSARFHPALASVEPDGWLREPIEITDPDACGYVTRADGFRLLTEIAAEDRYLRLPRTPADL
jgi:hypothetical protein